MTIAICWMMIGLSAAFHDMKPFDGAAIKITTALIGVVLGPIAWAVFE